MKLSRIKHILFDFDGTLGDSYEPLVRSFNAVFRHFGRPEATIEEIRPYVGIGLELTLTDLVGEEHLAEAIRIFRRQYLADYKQGSRLMPGARELLDALDGRYAMGLCSNKPGDTLRNLCDHLDISRYFRTILGAYDVPFLKPHAAMLEQALDDLDASAQDTLYVGDTLVDVAFADTCGVPYVLVLGGTGTREELETANAVALLEDLSQLPAILGIEGIR